MMGSTGVAKRRLIYVDMAYSLRAVRARKHEDFWHARHSRNYFEIVWGVHPIADVPDSEDRRHIRIKKFSAKQIAIEGTSRSFKLPRWLLPANFLISQARLMRVIIRRARRRGVSAVFATDPLYAGLFGLWLARRLKVPLIIFVPAQYDELYQATGSLGNPRLFRFRRVEQSVMRIVFRRCDMVFAAADSVAQLALDYGAPKEAVELLSHGKYVSGLHLMDPSARDDPPHVLKQYGIPNAPIYLICVGRLNPVKHSDDALRAMSIVLKARPDVHGIMAGDGELLDSLKSEAEALGIADRVSFPGLIDQAALSLILPRCVTLSPLTGMALIECTLAGSPVVAYDRDWQADFVTDGVSGFVVPFGDWQAMGEKALAVLADGKLYRKFSLEGRKRALAFVDIEGNSAKEHAAFDRMFERFARVHGSD